MCLIMTIFAAAVFTVLWLGFRRNGKNVKSLFTTMLAFWAAALMWSIDGVASVIGGEGFFDISMEDTLLGCIIWACGLALFGILFLKERLFNQASHGSNV